MDKINSFLVGSLVALLVAIGLVYYTHYQAPSRVLYVPQKPICSDIIRYEDGSLVCEINLTAEDEALPTEEI